MKQGQLSGVDSFVSSLIRALDRARSLVGGRRLSMLIFHRVHARPDPMFPGEPDAVRFRAILAWVARTFHVISLPEAVEALRSDRLRPGSVVITFDDGYLDNLEVATPILTELGLPATCFVSTGFLDGGWMWNDRIVEAIRSSPVSKVEQARRLTPLVPSLAGGAANNATQLCIKVLGQLKYLDFDDRKAAVEQIEMQLECEPPCEPIMMNRTQVLELERSGFEIGAHTINHPILTRLSTDSAKNEIVEGRRVLEELLGHPVRFFAFPNGKPGVDYGRREVALVREAGFEAAVSTAWGGARAGDDLFQLPRFTPWDHDPRRFCLRMALSFGKPGYDRVETGRGDD